MLKYANKIDMHNLHFNMQRKYAEYTGFPVIAVYWRQYAEYAKNMHNMQNM